MYEVTCFHCGHLAHISPDVERCAVCGADLRHLITPDYAARYFYERAAQMAAGGELTLALLEAERGLNYQPSAELHLLAAILAQRLGDHAQMRRHVASIPVDDVLRPEAEWLLRSQPTGVRSLPETRQAAAARARQGPAPPAWQAEPVDVAPRTERPAAVRTHPLLYGVVAGALVLFVLWLALEPIAEALRRNWSTESAGTAQNTPTPTASPAGDPPSSPDAGVDPSVPTAEPSPTPEIPPDLAQPAATQELLAGVTPILTNENSFDLAGFLAQTNRPELADLEVTAVLQGGTIKLQGVVQFFDHRNALIELAARIPNVTEVDATHLVIRLPETYTVQEGDSLWIISYKLYGTNRVADLFDANRETLPSPEALRVGQTLIVPPAER
jgi:nucleoid-associated protein YgaU